MTSTIRPPVARRWPDTLLPFLYFVSGFLALVYEIVWIREIALVVGSTTVALSTVLGAFFGGLALGSFAFGRIADRTANPTRLYGALESLTSAVCTDDASIDPGSPPAPFDTFVGEGTGRYNDASGATVKFTLTDAGEPGSNDLATIEISDSSGVVLLTSHDARAQQHRTVPSGTAIALGNPHVRVRLVRKLADQIDGIDLSGCPVGEVIDLPERKARTLVAEGWALIERRTERQPSGSASHRADDRDRRKGDRRRAS